MLEFLTDLQFLPALGNAGNGGRSNLERNTEMKTILLLINPHTGDCVRVTNRVEYAEYLAIGWKPLALRSKPKD